MVQAAIEMAYDKSIRNLASHLEDFQRFKELLSKKLSAIVEDITEVKGMFKQFVALQTKKTSNEVIITDLDEILTSLLKFESDKIIACV